MEAAFQKTLTRIWTTNSVKYENVITGAIKRNTSDKEVCILRAILNYLCDSKCYPCKIKLLLFIITINSGKGKQRSENKAFLLLIYLKLLNNKIKKRFGEFNKLFSDIEVHRVTSRNNRDMLR